ncbi:MAG: hypothetical protein QXN23_05860 [Candidatus Caldarchaeum sp.]
MGEAALAGADVGGGSDDVQRLLFIDADLAFDHALRLGREGVDVLYFNEWRHGLTVGEYMYGTGFDEVVNVIDYHNALDIVDFVFIADSGYGQLGDWLRKHGYLVYGASGMTDFLELNRVKAAEMLNTVGIKTPSYKTLKGVKALYAYLSEHSDVPHYVKVDVVRGSLETFKVETPQDLSSAITRADLGPFAHGLEFIVSEKIEGVEVGVDAWFNGREFLRPYHFGNEIKGHGSCFGKWVYESIWDDVLDRVEPLLRRFSSFQGTISFEAILNEDGLYVLDVAPRIARPAGSLQYYSLDNYFGCVKHVAEGESYEPRINHPYTMQLGLNYFGQQRTWVNLGTSLPDWLAATCRVVRYGGNFWAHVKADEHALFTLACAQDPHSCLNLAVGRTYEVSDSLVFSSYAVKRVGEIIEELRRYGVEW